MKTKQRGLKRKCRDMVARIEEETAIFPRPHGNSNYWHLHLPIARGLVDSRAVPLKVRRLCVQSLINQAHHLAQMAPQGEDVRVVVAVTLPELSASQIIVFFGPDGFRGFFDRNTQEQKWTRIERQSLVQRWQLVLLPSILERGFLEESRDGDCVWQGEVWFFGQLNE